jgi:hypothetical protein
MLYPREQPIHLHDMVLSHKGNLITEIIYWGKIPKYGTKIYGRSEIYTSTLKETQQYNAMPFDADE